MEIGTHNLDKKPLVQGGTHNLDKKPLVEAGTYNLGKKPRVEVGTHNLGKKPLAGIGTHNMARSHKWRLGLSTLASCRGPGLNLGKKLPGPKPSTDVLIMDSQSEPTAAAWAWSPDAPAHRNAPGHCPWPAS